MIKNKTKDKMHSEFKYDTTEQIMDLLNKIISELIEHTNKRWI